MHIKLGFYTCVSGEPNTRALPLPLLRVMHFHGVLGDERVEEGVVFLGHGALLSPQDPAETLRLLTPRSAVRGDLDEDVGFRQIERSVRHFRHEYRIHFGVVLKVLQNLHALALRSGTVDVRLAHLDGVG